MLSVIMFNVTYKPFVLNVVMLCVVRLNAIMLSVMAPIEGSTEKVNEIKYCRKLKETVMISNFLYLKSRCSI
jgi:hypothetical protein